MVEPAAIMPDETVPDATALRADLAGRAMSAEELMRATLGRIEAVNGELNAIVSLRDPDELMAEARAHDGRGPLGGLPMAVKDLVQTAGLRTTFGSPIFADHVPRRDDLLARRLREVGAILIGKTNVPEWGLGSHSFNPVHGVTANPFDTTKTAGGSSGGAAAALAANMVPLADGSDMMGSLRNPAAFCGIYGFRPTWGTVPNDLGGVAGDAALHQLSTDGPMARTPRDLALLLDVLAQPDPRFPFARRARPTFARDLVPKTKLSIGWLGDWGGEYPFENGILNICEAALARFGEAGATVEPLTPAIRGEDLWQAWLTLRGFATLSRLGRFHDHPTQRKLLKPEAVWEIERGLAVTPHEIERASRVRAEAFVQLSRHFERFDLLALPSAQVWPFDKSIRYPDAIAGRAMDTYHRWMEVVVPVSLTGLPAVSLPVGLGEAGLPMGLQLFGPRGADQMVLDAAAGWEEVRG